MQMKVQIFKDQEPINSTKLQQDINNWLESHPDIEVKHITQSQIQHGQGVSMPITICIWYREKLK
jgi:hypothetical protein